jgi:hypothetical protein
MERVRVLIQKLQQQEALNEAPALLLATVRALAAELEALTPRPAQPAGGRIAVVMPQSAAAFSFEAPTPEPLKVETPLPVPEDPEPLREPALPPAPPEHLAFQPPAAEVFEPPFDAMEEVPTLAQQAPREVHVIHTEPVASLHEKLKTNEPELAARHTGTPIKDLRKGISLNDRFLFLSELFRGDEAMYERSIKTINSFHILAEAEYWINRELKVKLGWDDSLETVQHFYGLVRRRFS